MKEENFQISQDKFESLDAIEKELVVLLNQYPTIVEIAADTYSPSEVANYIYALAKKFNTFYVDHSIAKAETESKKHLRADIALNVSVVIKHGLILLGISVPERM